ncbi:beta-fructofuranosidase, insoluble isoenzyme CWINV3-like isoform X2 [Momordica charantia]|uniref:Beta-fructofuranosidase, insoluble isoenzyme CWINV3-like isoform X2 n=1 Tax=Momordica charantia TaxID=3673 RepID=A0A6J1BRK6_MOMCH|nr:beta-fructofuranosidase, insoluble isoenzyme CWINV3-like isoform X2 [Momordica charantia]
MPTKWLKMGKFDFVGLCLVFLLSNGIGFVVSHGQTNELHIPQQALRTSYHFQPPKNWMNGPMYYKGVYHLFHQYNPNGAVFNQKMVWAHSISLDLINWVHLNPALEPTHPFDINGCWSGSASFLPGNKPVILYTGIDSSFNQVQNLAIPANFSDPFLEKWTKFPNNPIISPPDHVLGDRFRDPTTAWRGPDGGWRVAIGGQTSDGGGAAMLYRSEDFIRWNLLRFPLYSSPDSGTWECPDFFPVLLNGTNGVDFSSGFGIGVKHVMKASFNSHDYYTLGSYAPEEEKFTPDSGSDFGFRGTNLGLRYDYGKFYASKTFYDSSQKRRILWGWVNESDSREDDIKKGWSGLQAVPRKIWLSKTGRQLIQWPVEEIKALRRNHFSLNHKELIGRSTMKVPGGSASQVDAEVSFEFPYLEEAERMDTRWVDPQLLCSERNASVNGRVGPFGLLVLASNDLSEQTAVFFHILKAHKRYVVLMCSDQSRSSFRNRVDKTTYGSFVDIDPRHEKISLRTLVDHSVVESFAGEGKTCITSRVYPTLAVDKDARLYAFNNGTQSVVISSLNVWNMSKAQINENQP